MITVREFHADEVATFFEIHRAAVHGLAAGHYSQAILDTWSPPTLHQQAIEQFRANRDGELRLIAEMDAQPVGLGVLVAQKSELRACYVVPAAARRGVGTALVQEIERRAVEYGVKELHLESSLNAEPFYEAMGYEVVERTVHRFQAGNEMACVKMCKVL